MDVLGSHRRLCESLRHLIKAERNRPPDPYTAGGSNRKFQNSAVYLAFLFLIASPTYDQKLIA